MTGTTRRRKVGKGSLLTLAMGLIAWAFQRAALGDLTTAAFGFVFGAGLLALYQYADDVDREDVPIDAETLRGIAEQAGDAVEEHVDNTDGADEQ
jgi:hypothetical protein